MSRGSGVRITAQVLLVEANVNVKIAKKKKNTKP